MPILERLAFRVDFVLWRLSTRLRNLRLGHLRSTEPNLLSISPRNIRHTARISSLGSANRPIVGLVAGGDWDLSPIALDELDSFTALKEHFEQGIAWKDTIFYRRVTEQIRQGHKKWDCSTVEEFHGRLERLDRLFQDIKRAQYRTQGDVNSPKPWDEIRVCIGRTGELFLFDGRHRLFMAQLAGLDEVPVLVAARHKEWARFRSELESYAHDNGGQVYQPLAHPDLEHIPVSHDDQRFEMISESLSINGGALLDIGANLGYFCRQFERRGFDCVAVEKSTRIAYLLDRLRIVGGNSFRVYNGSIFDFPSRTEHFDVVLALNVFHHLLKSQQAFKKLQLFLQELNCTYLVFQAHHADESAKYTAQMQGSYADFSPHEFISFILSNSRLNHFSYIGTPNSGRPIFLLSG